MATGRKAVLIGSKKKSAGFIGCPRFLEVRWGETVLGLDRAELTF